MQELRFLFSYYCDVRPSTLTYDDTLKYLIYINKIHGYSKVKSKIAANSFFFRQVQNKPYKIPSILFDAHSNKLPAVMSVQEVYDLINVSKNTKHKTRSLVQVGIAVKEKSFLMVK